MAVPQISVLAVAGRPAADPTHGIHPSHRPRFEFYRASSGDEVGVQGGGLDTSDDGSERYDAITQHKWPRGLGDGRDSDVHERLRRLQAAVVNLSADVPAIHNQSEHKLKRSFV